MADKIVLITAQKPITGNYTYQPKPATAEIPKLVVAKPPEQPLVASTENNLLAKVVITNMGEEILPNPQLFRRAHDYYQVNDTITLTYRSIKVDLVAATDQFSRTVQYKRVFQQLQVTNDSYKVFVVRKGVVDTVADIELVTKRAQKVLADQVNETDQVRLQPRKVVQDTVSRSEVVVKFPQKAVNETVASTDVLSRTVNFNRSFSDVVDATDDFFGNANVDDDQTARVGKTLISWLASTDVRSIVLSVVKADVATTTDQKQARLTKPLLSATASTDQARARAQKILATAYTASDLTTQATNKRLLDVGITGDVAALLARKTLASASTTQHQLRYTATKPLISNFVAGDQAVIVWDIKRAFADQTTNAHLLQFGVAKSLQNTSTTTDQKQLNFSKTLNTGYVVADVFSRTVNYVRLFTDTVDATDDFFGSANIDDDQTARVGKTNIDWVDTQEQLQFASAKTLNTQFTRIDVLSNRLTKVAQSNSVAQDSSVFRTGKTLVSNTNSADQNSKRATKVLLDTSTATDQFSRVVNYQRSFLELVDPTEVVQLTPRKVLLSPAVATDSFSRTVAYVRQLASQTTHSEQRVFNSRISKLDTGTTTDSAAARTSKVLQTTFTRSDTVANTARKVAAELVTSSDTVSFFKFTNRFFNEIITAQSSGVINNQSYFAENYAQPGYAGTNTIIS